MKKIFKFAVVALAAAAVMVACQKSAANNDKQEEQRQEEQKEDEQKPAATTADLYVVNTPGWEQPAIWAWGGTISMNTWPTDGLDPEAQNVTEGGKEYVHFVLGEAFLADGIGLLVVDKVTSVQTVDVTGLNIKAGDKLYYEIGAEAGDDGKFALTVVE